MGILNITPDSFFDGGNYSLVDNALLHAEKMLRDGADIIDIGAQSTRPNATLFTAQEEWKRLENVIPALTKKFPEAIFSIDTFYADVAQKAVDAGVHMINDVSGGTLDENMFATVAKLQVPYVLMHMRGTPKTMQSFTQYTDVTAEVLRELSKKMTELYRLGVNDIIVDPGFGFAKTVTQNFELLRNLPEFNVLEVPVLVGLSRKSMITKTLQITSKDALNGTTALQTMALQNGANILRVHDVAQAKEVVTLYQTMMIA